MTDALRVGVIGGSGWLGGAIARAIVAAGVGAAEHLALSYRSARPGFLPAAHWTTDNQDLVDRSDVVIISVRPGDWPALKVTAPGKLAVSVMAGITLDEIGSRLQSGRIVRSLPNAGAEVGWSFTPWVASAGTTAQDRRVTTGIFEACGVSEEVSSERDLDYLTGLSGSGPAFPALLAEAMMRDAAAHGIDPDLARRAVTAVLIGAGRLLEKNPQSPADTVETFVAYRGTTAAAIETMRASGFDAAVGAGLRAALRKSAEMGRPA